MVTKAVNFKVEENLKRQFEAIGEQIGLTPTAMYNVFIKKVVEVRGIPFELKTERFDILTEDDLNSGFVTDLQEGEKSLAEGKGISFDNFVAQSHTRLRELVAQSGKI